MLSMIPSFSKSHAQEVGLPHERSLKLTVRGAFPCRGLAMNWAFGTFCGFEVVTVMKSVFTAVSLPPAFVTVRVTE